MYAPPKRQDYHVANALQIEKLIEMTSSLTDLLSLQAPSRDPFSVGPREHLNQMISMVAVSRNGDHRFLPLLLNKVNEILPRVASPMLQNAPENSNLANVNIFDGFGNAGMAQPPPSQMHMEFERKFSVEDYKKTYNVDMTGSTPESVHTSNHSGSPSSVPQHGSDMNGSFGGSPGADYSHNFNGFGCQPLPDMVMQQMSNAAQSNQMSASQTQQHQHTHQLSPPHLSPTHDRPIPHHTNGILPQSVRLQGMGMTSMPAPRQMEFRPPAQTQDGFNLQAPPQLQSLGDFNAMQRAGTDNAGSMMALTPIGGELDLCSIR